ncbi:MAG: APC family permease [Hamadaea sp.]|nr:APC family permease [Hamadaea sp.]
MSDGSGIVVEEHRTAPVVDRLKANSVGLAGVVFMAVATAAPVTAMTGNVPFAVAYGNGTGAPGGFIFATVVLTIFSVGYTAMARHITAAGAFYGFVSHGLGRVLGLAGGGLAVLAYVVFEASLIGIFATFARQTVADQLGVELPWLLYAAAMIVLNAVLAHFDIHLAARVLGVFLIGEVAILALLAAGVLTHGGGPEGISAAPLNPLAAFDDVAGGAAAFGLFLAFWSWVGFESTAMYGEESREPKKIIPKATMAAVVGLGLLYTLVSWLTISGVGPSRAVEVATAAPFDLFFQPIEAYVGTWAKVSLEWLMITSAFACGLAFHQCASRYLYAVGREGVLKPLGRTHPKHGSPWIASLVQTAVTVVIVGAFAFAGKDPYADLYTLMAILGTMALLAVQLLCSLAVIAYFRRRKPEAAHWWRTLVAPAIGAAGLGYVIFLMFTNMKTAAGNAAESLIFRAIPWIVVAVFVAGLAGALLIRARWPHLYDVLGRVVLEDAKERGEDGRIADEPVAQTV